MGFTQDARIRILFVDGNGSASGVDDPYQRCPRIEPLLDFLFGIDLRIAGGKHLDGQIGCEWNKALGKPLFEQARLGNERGVRSADGVGISGNDESGFCGQDHAQGVFLHMGVQATSQTHCRLSVSAASRCDQGKLSVDHFVPLSVLRPLSEVLGGRQGVDGGQCRHCIASSGIMAHDPPGPICQTKECCIVK